MLKILALTAFSEEELMLDYNYIYTADIVYFKNLEDAINVVKLLKDNEIQTLFL